MKNVIVDCNGSGDFVSLQDALNNIEDGDIIQVKGGSYIVSNHLNISKNIEVVGDKDNMPEISTDLHCLCSIVSDVKLSNIIFSYDSNYNGKVGLENPEFIGLIEVSSNAIFENCSFTNHGTKYSYPHLDKESPDYVYEDDYIANYYDDMEDNEINLLEKNDFRPASHPKITAVVITGSNTPSFESCHVYNIEQGFYVINNANPSFNHCDFRSCETGINLNENSIGRCSFCTFANNNYGIEIGWSAAPVIEKCDFSLNTIYGGIYLGAVGIYLHGVPKGLVTNCKFYNPEISKSNLSEVDYDVLHNSHSQAICSFLDSKTKFENCEITNLATCFFGQLASEISFKNCTISNLYEGFDVEGGNIRLEKCSISNCYIGFVMTDGELTLKDNKFSNCEIPESDEDQLLTVIKS